MSDQTAPYFDPKDFSTDSYVKKVNKPWGYELHWVREEAPYMGKVLHINEGARLSMQIHDQKQESWFIMNGRAAVIWNNDKDELVETELKPGLGYSTKVGQKHRLKGITECNILEVSSPEKGTTWRLEDDYARPDETPEQRKKERGEQ